MPMTPRLSVSTYAERLDSTAGFRSYFKTAGKARTINCSGRKVFKSRFATHVNIVGQETK